MSKVIKHNDVEGVKRLQSYDVESFSTVTRGLSSYKLQPFSEKTSVQDQAMETSMLGQPSKSYYSSPVFSESMGMDAFANADFEKSSGPRLFSSFDDDEPRKSNLFSTYEDDVQLNKRPSFTQDEEEHAVSTKYAQSSAVGEPIEGVDVTDGFQAMPVDELSSENANLPKSQQEKLEKELAESKAEVIKALEDEKALLQQSLADKDNELEALRQKLQQMEAELPSKLESSKQEGIQQGKQDAAVEKRQAYEAEKSDYLQLVQNSWNEALQEVKKLDDAVKSMDEQIPEIVIGYLRELVGAERKLNDEFVSNLIKSAIAKLTDAQQLIFAINPEDADIITEQFPQYGVTIDQNIPKGSVKIQTRTGDVDLSVDAWIDSLEKQINEQFKSS